MSTGHVHPVEDFRHEHVFLGADHDGNARRVWTVVALTTAMMAAEIAGGWAFGSLALIADGWHMSTHAAALTISALAYYFARRHARDARFAFGTGKLGDLASFTSAIVLGMVSLLIVYEAADHLIHPLTIAYGEAIGIAALGLAVNLLSGWLLRDSPAHHHGHSHDHDHEHDHHDHEHGACEAAHAGGHAHGADHGHAHNARDLNLRAAYVHVLADALVSVLAIGGLLTAKYAGWQFMDPLAGLVGAGVILSWSYTLVRQSGGVLVDSVPDGGLAAEMCLRLEASGDAVSDLHLWRVGPGHYAAAISILSGNPEAPGVYKARLADLPGLSHVTIEVERCPVPGCGVPTADAGSRWR